MSIPQDVPLRSLQDYLAQKAIQMQIPLSGTFELSPVCNFSCRMCYVRKTPKEVAQSHRRALTLEDWRRMALEARKAGMLNLLLTGGEPLLWPDFWTLYEELVDMGFLISINTNGSLINERAVERFLKRPPERINVTLYGASDETYRRLCDADGVFARVDRGIRMMKEAGLTVKINCSVTPENAQDLDWIVDYAKDRGVRLNVATYMFPPVRRNPDQFGENARFTPEESSRYQLRYLERERGQEAYLGYLRALREGCVEPPGLDEGCVDPVDGKVRCRAGRASFWITWDGWMTPCGMMPEPKADVMEDGFDSAWKVILKETAKIRLSGVCDNCPNQYICHTCAAIAYAETGSAGGIPTYRCLSTLALRRIAEEALSHKE